MTALSAALIAEIRTLVKRPVATDAALSCFTSFRIGGPADVLAEPENVHELAPLLRRLR